MRYEPRKDNNTFLPPLTDGHLPEIESACDLKIDPCWLTIKSHSDSRIREVFLKPICQANKFERSLTLRLPAGLEIIGQFIGNEKDLSESRKPFHQAVSIELKERLQKTQSAWKNVSSEGSSTDEYLRLLEDHSLYLQYIADSDNIFHKYTSVQLVRLKLKSFFDEASLILGKQGITPKEFVNLKNYSNSALKDLEDRAMMKTHDLVNLSLSITESREILEPLRSRFLEINRPMVLDCLRFKLRNKRDRDELIQTGMIGLNHALEKFDYSRNIRFSTYAYYWIKQTVVRSQQEDFRYGFSIPNKARTQQIQIERGLESLFRAEIQKPTIKDLSDATGLSQEALKSLPKKQVSLDQPFSLENSDSFSRKDTIPAPDSSEIDEMRNWPNMDELKAKLPLLLTDYHLECFSIYLNRKDPSLPGKSKSNSSNISHERARQVKSLAITSLSCLAILLDNNLEKLNEIGERTLAPGHLIILANLKSENPISAESLIKNPEIKKLLQINPDSNEWSPKEKSRIYANFFGLSRRVVNTLGNHVAWAKYPSEDKINIFDKFYSYREADIFRLYMSWPYDSVTAFTKGQKHSILRVGYDPSDIDRIEKTIQNMIRNIMPIVRAYYFRES